MNGVRSPAASKMQGDKKRQGIGVQGRDECLPFSRHGETIRGKGNAVFCPCFSLINLWLILPPGGVSFAFGTDFIKIKSVFVRTCALRRKAEMLFFQNSSQFQAACIINFFQLISIEYILLQDFKFSVQAAFGFVSQSAIALIMFAVSKRISQVNVVYHCGKGDQMAPPSGLPPPLKSWTKLFALY